MCVCHTDSAESRNCVHVFCVTTVRTIDNTSLIPFLYSDHNAITFTLNTENVDRGLLCCGN